LAGIYKIMRNLGLLIGFVTRRSQALSEVNDLDIYAISHASIETYKAINKVASLKNGLNYKLPDDT